MPYPFITTTEQLDQALEQAKITPILFFKHSTSCPISAHAHHELEQFLSSSDTQEIHGYVIHVIENRSVSLELADRVQVTHQSPQAILMKEGKVMWHDSHYGITQDSLQKAVRNL